MSCCGDADNYVVAAGEACQAFDSCRPQGSFIGGGRIVEVYHQPAGAKRDTGDIGNPAAWGAGGALQKLPSEMGFQAIRVKVLVEGDASREELDEIVKHANFYSPVANTLRNPIPFEISLAD